LSELGFTLLQVIYIVLRFILQQYSWIVPRSYRPSTPRRPPQQIYGPNTCLGQTQEQGQRKCPMLLFCVHIWVILNNIRLGKYQTSMKILIDTGSITNRFGTISNIYW